MAWVDLLSYVEKFDLLGIYVSMLKRITKTFIRKIFPIVLIFLIAFTLAFLCARKKQDEFKDFWVALLSISAMMADGFGYEDHSDFHIVDTHKYVVVISHLISSIFLIMIAIILMNLMVGVAVSDVEEVYMHAIESHSTLQIEHILELERICQAILNILVRFRCTKKFGARLKVRFIQQPNREVLAGRLKSEEVPKHIRDKDQCENLGQKLDELISLKEDMCNLMRLMKEEHERLREIAVR
ncbi:transient receptor potential cation channel subfamily A member 1-like [Ruditapes philippinarum]|uniref:transient receptor potential cation channel subfamily A member 1-like n=1 Tax=Ruditapes philippinarum TaxID=129788 RepID=UPI00295A63BC|nr:transient receptor potential cation channel subfamily A member 1-like [Ruditapes philippinarum]